MFPVVLTSTILDAMESCMLCKKNLYNGDPVVTIGERGSQGINNASKKREDSVLTSPGDTVNQQCRKKYCNPKSINLYQQKKQSAETPPTLRLRYCFEFSVHCLFCGQKAVKSEKKRKNDLKFSKSGPKIFSVTLRTYADSGMIHGQ